MFFSNDRQKTTQSIVFNQRSQVAPTNQSSLHLLFITMSAQEFALIPKENYMKNQPKALEVLDDPTISEKAHQLTLLQRIPPTKDTENEKPKDSKPDESKESIQKRVLRSITMLNPHQTDKSKAILGKLQIKASCKAVQILPSTKTE